jgi:hypothetical protein
MATRARQPAQRREPVHATASPILSWIRNAQRDPIDPFPEADMRPVITRRLRTHVVVALALFGAGCETHPTGVEVSQTEIWRLELEQLDDGGTRSYPRRGTITMRLRLNHSTQPDPTCADLPGDLGITTFVATVEAFPSRLQGPATGSADGSWNCHGMFASVQLNDGTTYTLRSDRMRFPDTSWSTTLSSWSAGDRTGTFVLGVDDTFTPGIRDSHVDVLVRNTTTDEWDLALRQPLRVGKPFSLAYGDEPSYGTYVDVRNLNWERIPASGIVTVSWPAHTFRRATLASSDRGLEAYGAWLLEPGSEPQIAEPETFRCLLPPDHGAQVELIITGDGRIDCGLGWAGNIYLNTARDVIYLAARQGATLQDTVSVIHVGFPAGVAVNGTSHPSITATLSDEGSTRSRLTVTAAAGAPRDIHEVVIRGLVPTGEPLEFLLYEDTVQVRVYELDAFAAPDTLTIPIGSSDTTEIHIVRTGGQSWDVALSVSRKPYGLVTTFDDELTGADIVRLAVDVGNLVPGPYQVDICAVLAAHATSPCTEVPLALIVAPPATITGTVYITSLPIAGVSVHLLENGVLRRETSTNGNGQYTFQDLPPGTYGVRITGYPNYGTFNPTTKNVTVGAGETATVDFVGVYTGDDPYADRH